jgi:hypothetical protein
MGLLDGLVETVRSRFVAWRERGAHIDRIMAEATNAARAHGIADARVDGIFHDPPPSMRDMARPGPAWFLRFGDPYARGVLFVEVDDATERVTRVWHTPR